MQHIPEQERTQVGGGVIHRMGLLAPDDLFVAVGVTEVVHVHDDGGLHIVHTDVGEFHTVNHRVLAAAPAGLDPQATVGMEEVALA